MKASVQVSRGIESLFGTRDENIRLIESGLGVSTKLSSDTIEIEGEPDPVARAECIFQDYFALVAEGNLFKNGDLNSLLRVVTADPEVTLRALVNSGKQRSFGKKCSRRRPLRSADISKPSNVTTLYSASVPPARARLTSPSRWRFRH